MRGKTNAARWGTNVTLNWLNYASAYAKAQKRVDMLTGDNILQGVTTAAIPCLQTAGEDVQLQESLRKALLAILLIARNHQHESSS